MAQQEPQVQPTSQQLNNLKIVDLLKQYGEFVSPGEIKDIFDAIKTLKVGSGWGRIEIVYLNSEMSDVDIIIKRKPKKKTT